MKDQIKIQVSDDGLFGRPVNPFEQYIDGGYINEDWIQFNDKHPQFPLTTPQIPKSVVIGEVVWQAMDGQTDEWFDLHKDTYDFCDNKFETCFAMHNKRAREAYKIITPVPNSEPKEDFAIKKQKEGVFYSIIGGNIIKGRNNKNITQEQLGSRLGISRVSVGNIESGKQRLPVHLMHQVANALNIDLMDLFNGLDRKFSKKPLSKQTINSTKRQTSHDKALEILRHKFDETEYETVLPVSTDSELLEGYKSEYEAMIEIANWQAQQQPVSKSEENTILSYHQALNAIAVCEDIKVIRAIVKETLEINK